MIPYAILSGTLIFSDQSTIDFRILDLSVDSFTFRLSKRHMLIDFAEIQLKFYHFSDTAYSSLVLKNFSITQIEKNEYFNVYQLYTEDPLFFYEARHLMQDYMQYIDLKLNTDDISLSHTLADYPEDKENSFAPSYQEWKKHLMNEAKSNYRLHADSCIFHQYISELALDLSSDFLIGQFLNLDWKDFQTFYWHYQNLEWHEISKLKIKAVYFGNQYCFSQIPSTEILYALLDQTYANDLIPVLMLPPIPERDLVQALHLIEAFKDYYAAKFDPLLPKLEIVINDWGIANLLQKPEYQSYFESTLGILLNKRRKDTRLPYKKGISDQENLLNTNSLNAAFYQNYLKENYGISHYSYETCEYDFQIPKGTHRLHFPLYQMNTSGYCTLYSICKYQDRGKQHPIQRCPGYCSKYVILYPEHLHMIGFQNSLFGFDQKILWDTDYLKHLAGNHTLRFILSLF